MIQSLTLACRRSASRILLASLVSLPLSLSCSDDEVAPPPPLDFTLSITALDDSSPDGPVPLRCDGLGVSVEIESASDHPFILRPADACGSSNRCGYVRIQGLTASDTVLGQVDTVTKFGLLENIAPDSLPELAQVRATLIRGIDDEPVINADGSTAETVVSVQFVPPAAPCPISAGGSGGAPSGGGAGPGQGGGSSEGGSPSEGGSGTGGAPAGAGGSGGSPDSGGQAGAGPANAGTGGI